MTAQPGLRPPFRPARPRTSVDVDLLLDVVKGCQRSDGAAGHLEVRVVDPEGPRPVIVLDEDDRSTSVPALELADRLSREGVDPSEAAVAAAFHEWVDARPATDREALEAGVSTLGWTGRGLEPRWRVVVLRAGGAAVEWVPSWRTSRDGAAAVRRAALARAARLPVTPVPVGDVVLWVHPAAPLLSSAVLAQPDALLERHPVDGSCAVVAPGRPVAVADRVAAQRLGEESAEAHVVVPLRDVVDGRWPLS